MNTSAAGSGGVIELDAAGFGATIPRHPFAIVDFWAPWCGPCRVFAPVFAAAAAKHPGILFAKVDTEVERELAAQFGIRSIPTLLIFRDDVIVYAEAGALPGKALDEVIAAAAALDMDAVRRELATQEAPSPGADTIPQ